MKAVRSVTSKSKKLYMLFDVIPSKEITGGPWYTEQEFDHEFVEELCNYIVQYIRSERISSPASIHRKVQSSGISRVELSVEELDTVIQTLMYDGRIELVHPAVVRLEGKDVHAKYYKVSAEVDVPNYLTSAPCGVCPVSSQCTENGAISPSTCEYMKLWLNMPAAQEDQGDLF